jgi:cytochrome P450
LAFLYLLTIQKHEILRLHPTFLALTRCTGNGPQVINYRGRQHTIPEDTTIFLCLVALHYNPSYWGDDVNNFAPQKWDSRRSESGWFRTEKDGTCTTLSQETQTGSAPFCHLRQPIKGAYLPFSDGFRGCLGRNFALVELSAFLAMLFRSYKVVIAARDGETQDMANRRASETIEKGTRQRLTLSLRDEVGIKLVKRGS